MDLGGCHLCSIRPARFTPLSRFMKCCSCTSYITRRRLPPPRCRKHVQRRLSRASLTPVHLPRLRRPARRPAHPPRSHLSINGGGVQYGRHDKLQCMAREIDSMPIKSGPSVSRVGVRVCNAIRRCQRRAGAESAELQLSCSIISCHRGTLLILSVSAGLFKGFFNCTTCFPFLFEFDEHFWS